jgi:ABC-type Fe3+/spermidine/putrescine transport system ATPase subunit
LAGGHTLTHSITEKAIVDVKLEGLTKHFGKIEAVNELYLDIMPGEYIALVGPSGCGKTTTLHMIAGFIKPTAGSVYIKGVRVDQLPSYKRGLGLVFQQFAIFPHLSVFENVAFGLQVRNMDKTQITESVRRTLSLVGLERMEKSGVKDLSSGEKQRVGLARALAVSPAVLLLDEPLGSLDAQLRLEMRELLRDLHQKLGLTFIHVTHDQDEAFSLADRVVVMNTGRIEQVDSPYNTYYQPRSRFVAEFVGSNNVFDAEVVSVDKEIITVKTSLGLVKSVISDDSKPIPGQSVTIVVRAVDLHSLEPDEVEQVSNRISCKIVGWQMRGNQKTVLLETENGLRMWMEEHETSKERPVLEHGEKIMVGWHSQDTYMIGSK